MPYALVHAGGQLWKVSPAGVPLPVALPAGVTLSLTRKARFAVLQRRVVMVHAPTRNLQIDGNLIVHILTPRKPLSTLTAAVGAAGAVTGVYQYAVTFAIMDGTRVVTEGPPSDPSNAVTVDNEEIALSNIPTSGEPGINARRIYRTTDGPGREYFLAGTIFDNATTVFTDNKTDEETDLFPIEPALGEPPGTTNSDWFEVIATWRDRLWAASNNNPDRVYFSGNRLVYAWNPANRLVAQPEGEDLEGVTAFAPRRDELGVGKRRSLWKVIGDTPLEGGNRFQMIRVAEGIGIWGIDTVNVIRDTAYFLAEDGVYSWDAEGVKPLSRDKVHSWFTTDAFFNRAMFANAVAHYNQQYDSYDLFLASAGSTVLDRWVSYDLQRKQWYGPHLTRAFVPTAAGNLEDVSGMLTPMVGGADGNLWAKNRPGFSDHGQAIPFDVIGKFHSMGDPDATKYWGEPTIFTKQEPAGTLVVRTRVGGLDAPQGPIPVSLSRVADVVTAVSATPHYLAMGSMVQIAGANEGDYNGLWEVTGIVSPSSYTFSIGALTPATPATGPITMLDPTRADILHDLTRDRQRLRRLGVGRMVQFQFLNDEDGQAVEVQGYEVNPVHPIGRR